jgi:glycosyltransferase involved in cell wall biosynthesis
VTLAERLEGLRVGFGIPSYNEGAGIVHTLDSLDRSAGACDLRPLRIFLSDSSGTEETVEAARAWSSGREAELTVVRSERRRSLKEARNVVFDHVDFDPLVFVDADLVVTPEGLSHLLLELTESPPPDVVTGSSAPDPAYRALRYRASAWQLRTVRRLAASAPRERPRGEGAFWGCRRSFYSGYRFPLGSGSIVDDIELTGHLLETAGRSVNCWRAFAYKVPAGTLSDFFVQTHRGYAGGARRPSLRKQAAAALRESVRDPLGALLYVHARLWSARARRRRTEPFAEQWDVPESTKRPRVPA